MFGLEAFLLFLAFTIMTIYEDDAPHVLGAVVTLMLLALITFGMRVYVRYGSTWGPEDSVMAVAVVSALMGTHPGN